MDSSTIGRQRRSTAGGANPKSQSVMVGRSITRKSARNVSVTRERMEPNSPPAMPSSAFAASGSPAARSLSADAILSSAPAAEVSCSKPALLVSSSQYPGSASTNSAISSHTGPAASSTSAPTATNMTKNTVSAALPRFQPRRWSAPTTGSSPSAITAARKIEISVPSDRIASATSAQAPSSTTKVRTPTTTSTRCGAGPSMVTARYARHRRRQGDQATSTSTATTIAIRSSAPESAATIQPGALRLLPSRQRVVDGGVAPPAQPGERRAQQRADGAEQDVRPVRRLRDLGEHLAERDAEPHRRQGRAPPRQERPLVREPGAPGGVDGGLGVAHGMSIGFAR